MQWALHTFISIVFCCGHKGASDRKKKGEERGSRFNKTGRDMYVWGNTIGQKGWQRPRARRAAGRERTVKKHTPFSRQKRLRVAMVGGGELCGGEVWCGVVVGKEGERR